MSIRSIIFKKIETFITHTIDHDLTGIHFTNHYFVLVSINTHINSNIIYFVFVLLSYLFPSLSIFIELLQ